MGSTNFSSKITPAATEDLREITEYITVHLGNLSAANRLWRDLIEAIDNAAMYPYSMPIVHNERITTSDFRKILIRNFVAIYKIVEETKEIQILRVFYAPSNLINLF